MRCVERSQNGRDLVLCSYPHQDSIRSDCWRENATNQGVVAIDGRSSVVQRCDASSARRMAAILCCAAIHTRTQSDRIAGERTRLIKASSRLMADPPSFRDAMRRALAEWPRSCAVQLSTPGLNQIGLLARERD